MPQSIPTCVHPVIHDQTAICTSCSEVSQSHADWFAGQRDLQFRDEYRYGEADLRDQLTESLRNRLNYSVRIGDLMGAQIMVARLDWIAEYLRVTTCEHPGLFTSARKTDVYCPSCDRDINWTEL